MEKHPLSRYRPMLMPEESPIGGLQATISPFEKQNVIPFNQNKRKKNDFASFPVRKVGGSGDGNGNSNDRFPHFPANGRPSHSLSNLKSNFDKPIRSRKTTARPIPIPGKDFDFVIPHKVPPRPASPNQPALPVAPFNDPFSDDNDYNDYQDRYGSDYDYDLDYNQGLDDDKSDASVGFMNSGFGPSWEPSKLTKRKKRSANHEGRSAASSIFWHNGQPIRPRNRNKNRRRNRQNVWGNRNPKYI